MDFRSLGEVIEHNEKTWPDAPALFCEGVELSNAQFANRVRRLASTLHHNGANKQHRVAILAMNCPEYLEVCGIADLCGYVITTVNFRLAASEVVWIVNNATPSVFIFEERFAELIGSIRDQIHSVKQFICIGEAVPDWARPYEAVVESGDPGGPPFRSLPDDYVQIMYTSGTTGRPKGVLFEHSQLMALTRRNAEESGSRAGTTGLVVLPLFHLAARTAFLTQLIAGGTVIIHRHFDALRVLQSIEREKINVAHVVPTILDALIEAQKEANCDLSSLQWVSCLGSVLSPGTLRRAIATIGPVLVNSYGTTEGGLNTMLRSRDINPDGDEDAVRRSGSVGNLVAEMELKITDDDGLEVPAGTIGEICVRSAQTMAGYWNNNAATLEVMHDGWFFSGDMGYVDEHGYLYLMDRKKDMIVSGGENIYSAEVEIALSGHPAVAEVAVIGIPDPKWGESVLAVVVAKSEMMLTEAEVIGFARSQIATYKCPKGVVFRDALDRNPTGKVDKVSLRNAYRGRAE